MFETISKEWMLVTAGTKDKFNTMTDQLGTASEFLWNKPVAFIFIRPERYTFDFIEQNDYLTLSFLGEEYKDVHKICGSKSGRDIDKVKATGLQPLFTENGSITLNRPGWPLSARNCMPIWFKPEDFIDQSIIRPMVWRSTRRLSQNVCGRDCQCIGGNLIKRAAEFLKWKAYILFLAQFPRTGSLFRQIFPQSRHIVIQTLLAAGSTLPQFLHYLFATYSLIHVLCQQFQQFIFKISQPSHRFLAFEQHTVSGSQIEHSDG